MGADVYANGQAVSGKASGHNVIAAMPDVCLSPPSPPAGPIPIPYPNFAQASDTTDGSKKVKAGGKEINLKGQSKYKSCKGDEACTKTFGMGVVSHSNTGAVKHEAGSFDVKVEGSAVVRHLDITTGNHSNPTNGSIQPDADKPRPGTSTTVCKKLENKNDSTRDELKEETEDKSVIGKDKRGRGTTVSSMSSKPAAGGRAATATAHNNQKAVEKSPSPLAAGGDESVRDGSETPLCSGSKYKHPAPAVQKSGHAEARLMAEMPQSKPRVVTINIDWQAKDGPSKMPCRDCHKMLCAAQKDCKHKIYLCGEGNVPQSIDETCPAKGEPTLDDYNNLKTKMGENFA